MGTHYYVVIKDLNKLVSEMQKKNKKTHIEKHAVPKLIPPVFIYLERCIHLERHQLFCMENEPAIVNIANVNKSSVHFKNIGARSYSPFAVYFDWSCAGEGGDSEK